MEINEHLLPALRAAIVFLEQHNYRYALIGGVSLSQWGYSRYTLDVDIKGSFRTPNTPLLAPLSELLFPNRRARPFLKTLLSFRFLFKG